MDPSSSSWKSICLGNTWALHNNSVHTWYTSHRFSMPDSAPWTTFLKALRGHGGHVTRWRWRAQVGSAQGMCRWLLILYNVESPRFRQPSQKKGRWCNLQFLIFLKSSGVLLDKGWEPTGGWAYGIQRRKSLTVRVKWLEHRSETRLLASVFDVM